ncbi:WhiB family transcriptional regulator [Streptomyces olivoreticuli]
MALFSRHKAPDWSADGKPGNEAKCRKLPTPHTLKRDIWFDDPHTARAVCNGDADGIICPMRQQCLMQAMINCERHGVWAGLSEEQLAWMRKEYRREPAMWNVDNAPSDEELAAHASSREDTTEPPQEATGPIQLELPF